MRFAHVGPATTQGHGGEVAAYFDLDGTLLNASSEKTLTAYLARRRPWRIPWGAVAWTSGFITNMIRGRAVYDAAATEATSPLPPGMCSNAIHAYLRVRSFNNFHSSTSMGKTRLASRTRSSFGFGLATVAPMAEAMADVLGMDAVYGCGPEVEGILSGSERGWSVPRRKGRYPSSSVTLNRTVMI